jgi:chemotaxis protein methyltransferase CheR
MVQVGSCSLAEYLQALEEKKLLRLECDRLMTVSISRFFRDRALWQTLEHDILPTVIAQGNTQVKAWSAGCACGEEVYSLRIVWDLLSRRFEGLPGIDILATDANPLYLEKAKAGVYSKSSLKEIPESLQALFFRSLHEGTNDASIKPAFKKNIRWQTKNLLSGVPKERFHLIFLRNNLLTYYEAGLVADAFRKVIECLEPHGYIIIGAHEKAPFITTRLIRHEKHAYVFLYI